MANTEEQVFLTFELFPDMGQFYELEASLNDNTHEEEKLLEWAHTKIGTLQSRLESLQVSKGGKLNKRSTDVAYFPAHIILSLANDVFGYNGWSSEVLECSFENLDTSSDMTSFSIRVYVKVRITLRDGFQSEAEGIGEANNLPFKYMCYNSGKKQAMTDATKRAIIGLGEVLINSEK